MLTIVLHHISTSLYDTYTENLFGLLWSVPIFFIIAGFFLQESDFKDSKMFLKRKFKSLYVPATVYYLIAVVLHNFFVGIDWYRLGSVHPGNGIPYYLYDIQDYVSQVLKVILCAGSGESIMGAMWFIYTLMYSMVIILILEKFVFSKIIKNRKEIRFILLLAIQFCSCILSQKLSFTISRISVVATVLFLIYLGYIIHQKLKIQFNDVYALTISLILFFSIVVFQTKYISLAANRYPDVVSLCIGSLSMLYIIAFIAKKIQTSRIGTFLAFIGRNSLHIMALHILGFMICNTLLIKTGVFTIDSSMGMNTFVTDNIYIYICYAVSGVCIPLFVISLFRYLKGFLLRRLYL